jgi:mucolipin 3
LFDIDDGIATESNGVEVMIGLGCMAAWIGLIRYMETSKNYSILAKTLSFAMPNVLKTLISALPVLMGYTFLGLALFWQSNRFSSAPGCLTTLYSLMFGDMVYDTFHDLSQTNYLSSQLYLYSFVFFSVCVINSLFISVIVDAFNSAKNQKKESAEKNDSIDELIKKVEGLKGLKEGSEDMRMKI